jgi:hypothetical protein
MFGLVGFNCRVEYGFFRPEQQGNESNGGSRTTVAQSATEGWGKIIARLIQANHSFSEIKNYTLAQIKIFSKYAQELERERRAGLIADLAIASQGDGKTISKAVDRLMQ